MAFKKTSCPAGQPEVKEAKEEKGKNTVFTRNGYVCDKLQAAGYVVKSSKQMTMLGSKEFELEGNVELTPKALNDAIAHRIQSHQNAQALVKKLTVTDADLSLVYEESEEPTPEVKAMKEEMAESEKARLEAKKHPKNKEKVK